MAELFLAQQPPSEELVVLKRILPYLSEEPEFVQMFLDEAKIAAQLHHPNIVQVYELGKLDNTIFIAMEFVEGIDLRRVMAEESKFGATVPYGVAAAICAQVASGLDYAHNSVAVDGRPLELIHRDVSPQNVIVGADDGVARVTDFGIARAAERSVRTRTGQIKGKLRYMAPEQATERGVDRRADVFAAGVVLWEMLAGRRFFQGENDAKLLLEITAPSYPDLAALRPELPAELCALVTRALAPDPAGRWPTALDFARALERWGRAADCLAHHAEVAALIDEACGDQVRAQREAISAALRRPASVPPAEPSSPGSPARRPTLVPSATVAAPAHSQPPLTGEPLAMGAAGDAAGPPRGFTRSLTPGAGVVALAAALGGTLLLWRPRGEPAPAPPAAAAAPAASVRVRVVSEAGVRAVESPLASDVRVTAEGATLSLPKSEEPVRLTITLANGERVAETVRPDGNAVVHVRPLPDAAPPAPPAPSATVSARPPGRPPPAAGPRGLKKNPYD